MPIPSYLFIEEIPGSVDVEGREASIQVVEFIHVVQIPTGRQDGKTSGTRVHGNFTITKNYDKSSPLLYQYLCHGKVIPSAKLKWYEIDSHGNEKEFFIHTLKNARVTMIKAWMPNVDNPETERLQPMEDVSFQYEKISWKFVKGNVETNDSWKEEC